MAFVKFWKDFLIGDAPELFVGTLVFVAAALALRHHSDLGVVVLPVIVIVFLAASVLRGRARLVSRPSTGTSLSASRARCLAANPGRAGAFGSGAQGSCSVRQVAEPAIAELLGRVVASLPVGEVRPGQLKMAEAVQRALASGGNVAVAAGTGTGKSLAYLVPAVASSKHVVVATATKALQDQLANKDLPLVASGLGRAVNWAVLKGRSNYLCRQRLYELERLGSQQRLDAPLAEEPADPGLVGDGLAGEPDVSGVGARGGSTRALAARRVGEEVRRLVEWAESSASGDRAELDFEPSVQAWSSLSVTSDECPGARRCPAGGECFAEAARAKAGAADIVIVNLHLFGAHLRTGGEVLPEHEALIIDEAHELEDVLASSLGVEVSPGRLRAIASGARTALVAAGRRAQRGEDTAAASDDRCGHGHRGRVRRPARGRRGPPLAARARRDHRRTGDFGHREARTSRNRAS